MIKCKICGLENKHSIHRHIKKHNISVNEYKQIYQSEVYSDEYKQKISKNVSKQMINRWKDDLVFKKRHLKKLHTKQVRLKISNTLKENYQTGKITVWNVGKTKDTDIRIKKIGEKNKQHLTGRNKYNDENCKNHSLRMSKIMKERWKYNPIILNDDSRKKISETLSKKYANGELTIYHNRFKTGWYVAKNGNKFYYMSGLEEKTMIYLDNNNDVSEWTNKHGIRIRYIDENNIDRIYVPDFLIKLKNNIESIIEMKGFNLNPERTKLKKKYTKKLYKNYYIIKTIDELEKKINEIIKNK